MVAVNTTETLLISKDHHGKSTICNIEMKDSMHSNWFYGIVNAPRVNTEEDRFQVTDRGNFIEFILPRGTAQFTEMRIHDAEGNLVWRKQAFNKRILKWYKQSVIGTRVPEGEYRFQLQQGSRQVAGIAKVA